MEKFVIIDGNSLINRAFYGLPMLKSLSGKPCNAVYGFINMMLNVISKEKPKYLVCTFDAGKHTFRHNMYAEYKGKRDKMPEDLAVQLPLLKEMLSAMNIKTLEMPEIEADDLLGSLTRKFNEEFILVSGDKDLLQLINEHTTVWLTQKGISNVLKLTPETLKAEMGIEPYQVIELKSIMGDASDNIPGVAGIGKIGANELIAQYGSLDNIFANINNVPTKYQKKLVANKETAYLSHQLATIKIDVELNCTLEDCELKLPFNEKVYSLMKELDFKSMLARKELFAGDVEQVLAGGGKHEAVSQKVEVVEINSQADFNNMLAALGDSFAVLSEEFSFNFAKDGNEFVLYKSGEIFNANITKIKELFEGNAQKIVFDAKQLMHELSHYSMVLNNYCDVSLAIYIANQMDAEITFADALKLNEIPEKNANALLTLKEIYINKLIQNTQLKLYSNIELPLVAVLFEMEQTGFKVDTNIIKTLTKTYKEELAQLTTKIYELAGEEFNINSPKQLQVILFEKLKIEYKGKKSTSVEVLKAIEGRHEIVSYILRYRKINKLITTYLDGMLNYVGADNKIHTTFMQRTTSTGRLSSREPNLQNLPIRDDEGKLLRKMFISSFDGGTLISADYNQIELRLIANFSEDESMIADYLSGKDIHTATASKIFGVGIDEVTGSMRRTAKTVNFGIIYGISAYGLSESLGCSPKEASEFINKYMSIYPKVKEYGEKQIQFAREKGYVCTMMGRIRHIPDVNSSNHIIRGFAERTAKNMPLQGSASDIIKIAMINVNKAIKNQNLNSKLILQIHDELIVDCFPGEEEIVKTILKQEMERVAKLTVPLKVEVSQGKTLYDAKD